MSQTKSILKLGLAISVLGLMASVPLGAAQKPSKKANWDNLKQLLPGEPIRVTLKDGQTYQGKLQMVSDEAIAVHLVTDERSFSRESVSRISFKDRPHRGRNAALGAVIGGGSGAAIGAIASSAAGLGAPFGLVIGLLVGSPSGAGIGGLVPTGRWKDVYRVR